MPGVASLRTYERRWLRSDVVAGIVLAAILVPQGMAYAELAGLPPVNGLYTTIACLVGYALMGPSKILVLGPDSSLGPLIFAAIAPLVVAGDDPATAIALAGMLAILVGLIEIGLGVGKLGFVADLLSSEVQVGYMNGLAIIIIVGQLPKLCGFSTDADSFVDEVREFVTNFDQRDATALTVGLVTLAVLLVLPRLTRKIPAVLVAVVGATVVTARVRPRHHAPSAPSPKGLPTPTVPWTELRRRRAAAARRGGHHARVADRHHRPVDLVQRPPWRAGEAEPRDDRHRLGQHRRRLLPGVRHLGQQLAHGRRRAVGGQEPAQPASSVPASWCCCSCSSTDCSPTCRTPRWPPWSSPRRSRSPTSPCSPGCGGSGRSAVLLSLVASAGVIFLGVLEGIVVAIVLSILLFFHRNWWPHGDVLGRVPGREGWHSDPGVDGLDEHPDVVVFRWEAPLFFANAGIFADQVRELVEERQPAWVVLQCEAITDIDVTAAGMLERLDNELNAKGVHLAFVELRTRLHDLVHDYGLLKTLDRDHFYASIDEALRDIESRAATRSRRHENSRDDVDASPNLRTVNR